jgi:hypothetical protein
MEPSFRKLLAVHPHGRDDPELILEAFRRFLQDISPRYGVHQWQVYEFGQRKWPYAKWLFDKLAWFLADRPKLLHALAELERDLELEHQVQISHTGNRGKSERVRRWGSGTKAKSRLPNANYSSQNYGLLGPRCLQSDAGLKPLKASIVKAVR